MNCNPGLPGGLADCKAALEAWRNFAVLTKGTQFSSKSDAGNKSKWIAKLNADLTVFVPQEFNSNEPTTDDVTINTAQFGQKLITGQGVPSMLISLSSNLCDAKEMEAQFNGGVFDVIGITEGGDLDMTSPSTGKYGGYRARIWAIRDKIVNRDEAESTFKVYVMFQDLQDWDGQNIIETVGWNPLRDLPEAMPEGINLVPTVDYSAAGGTMTVKAYDRCGDLKIGLVTANFEVLRTNDLTSPTITAAETPAASGIYVLTIQKGAVPANLDEGDWIQFRVNVIVTSVTTNLSNRLTAYAGA
jgi:tellurite resistance-related uncharacterized protein